MKIILTLVLSALLLTSCTHPRMGSKNYAPYDCSGKCAMQVDPEDIIQGSENG